MSADGIVERTLELGCETGQLLTPLSRYKWAPGTPFGIDNGAFSKFNGGGFLRLLARNKSNREHCLFVAAPDVVGSARRTLECFDRWYPKLHGWPVALVAQDGIEDLPIPWDVLSAVFIGGSTAFKLSKAAESVVRAALVMDKHIHIGRVNTPDRYDYFAAMGAHSCDGTGVSKYTHMAEKLTGANALFAGAAGESCSG